MWWKKWENVYRAVICSTKMKFNDENVTKCKLNQNIY